MTSVTKLSKVWGNSTNETASLVSASGLSGDYVFDDISLLQSCNVVGSNASIPGLNSANFPNFSLSTLESLDNNFGGSDITDFGVSRVMRDDVDEDAYCNSFFISYNGNYQLRSFMSGTTTIYKNGTSAGTITAARSTTTLSSLVVGDRISFDKPCSIHNTTTPGTQGIYNGYCGYSFATRIDRRTITFRIFNMSTTDTINYEVKRTSTSDSNVTSMTDFASGTISSGGFATVGPTATQGNYFIIADGLICCTRGDFPSSDVIMLYPLTMDPKYGWFSSNGHTFAVNNAFVEESDSDGGDDIKGRTSGNGQGNIITGLNSGAGNVFISDGVSSPFPGGNYFSGEASVIFASPGPTTGAGTLFGAESQGDGNGTEMTTFTATAAHSYACISGAGAAWVAFVRAGANTLPAYASGADPVILHYDGEDFFQQAISFNIGTTSYPPISKAYIGNGSGTGTAANAGDWFVCNFPMQAFQDTTAALKDESNMIMGEIITLPELVQLTFNGVSSTGGYSSSTLACSNGASGEAITVFCTDEAMAEGQFLAKTQTTGDVLNPFNGEGKFFRHIPPGTRTAYYVQVNYNGVITAFSTC